MILHKFSNRFRGKLIFVCLLMLFFLSANSQNYYFGDLHVHTNLSDGKTEPQEVYNYAKNQAKIDFICVTDHDRFPYDNFAKWGEMQREANNNNIDNQFVSFIGYEYTSNSLDGHRTVIYPSSSGPMLSVVNVKLDQLVNQVNNLGGIVNVAHPNYIPFASSKTPLFGTQENNIEIFSLFRYEYFNNKSAPPNQLEGSSVNDWLLYGKVFGFLGVSDSHDGKPGKSGLTGVYCDSLNRESIFDAIKKRHTFVTTNGSRIRLKLSYKNYIMGDIISTEIQEREFIYEVKGDSKLKKIELIKNNLVIDSVFTDSISIKGSFKVRDTNIKSYYYLRVTQKNGEMAWSSPIYFRSKNYLDASLNVNKILINTFPNPTNGTFTINFFQPQVAEIITTIYDINKKVILQRTEGLKGTGLYNLSYNLKGNVPGTYFLIISSGNFKKNAKILLVK